MKFILQSCGLDSTGYLLKLLETTNDIYQPIFIAYTHGGKSAKEWKILTENIFPLMKKIYHNRIRYPQKIRLLNKDKMTRNQQFVELIRDELDIKEIYMGILSEDSFSPNDTNPKILEEKTNVKITVSGWNNKIEVLEFIKCYDYLEEIIRKTSSCQLRFKKHCGRCFSCKKRFYAFYKIYGDKKFNVIFDDKLIFN